MVRAPSTSLIALLCLLGACASDNAPSSSPSAEDVEALASEGDGLVLEAPELAPDAATGPLTDVERVGPDASSPAIQDVTWPPDAGIEAGDASDTLHSPDAPVGGDITSDAGLEGDTSAELPSDGALDTDSEPGCTLTAGEEPLAPFDTWSTDLVVAASSQCVITLSLNEDTVLEVVLDGGEALVLKSPLESEPRWRRPTEVAAGEQVIKVINLGEEALEATLSVIGHGPPPEAVDASKSLVWTSPPMTEATSLQHLMALVSDDGHGGALLNQWFQRFASTAHSERLGPLLLLEAYDAVLGPEPSAWDLALLPFHVTGVQNRMDLADGTHCGEFRVSLASHDPVYKPLHLIFLFHQPPGPGDLSPSGALHCTATALRWARLAELGDDATFEAAALDWMGSALVSEAFSHIETVEFIVSPWEWRQWFLDEGELDNRPLFQTVDIPALNAPGPLREAFIAWVTEEAEALATRRAFIPEAYRAASARASQGVPWVPLDLSGVAPEVLDAWPQLRQQIELVGCPGCHTADAEFVHTEEEGTLSPFFLKELEARVEHLHRHWQGGPDSPPYGPLQLTPLGHP